MDRLRFVAFAAATGRVGVILLDGNQLKEWKMSTTAGQSCAATKEFARNAIRKWEPHVVVIECIDEAKFKGDRTKQIISVIASVAEESELLDVSIKRTQRFDNKYDEAADMVARYPALAAIKPVRRFYECEPRSTVIFEAIALAESVKRDPTPQLEVAMG